MLFGRFSMRTVHVSGGLRVRRTLRDTRRPRTG